MRALRLHRAGEPIRLDDIDTLDPGPGEVVVVVQAAGICHSDVHYRSGSPEPARLPVTLGHETAGEIVAVGVDVAGDRIGDRVAVHYVLSCGACPLCHTGREQFCAGYQMTGLTVDGGWADRITVPSRNAVTIPEGITTENAAVMMCSSATSFHALRRGRMAVGDSVAVFGAGGLGLSAVQLAFALGAVNVTAIDVCAERLAIAETLGATAVESGGDLVERLGDAGPFDVALDLVGDEQVLHDALASLAPGGRVVAVGITARSFRLDPYRDVIGPEAELIGSNDHTLAEIEELFGIAEMGALDLGEIITGRVPLDADDVNDAMDELERYGSGVRTVIAPQMGP